MEIQTEYNVMAVCLYHFLFHVGRVVRVISVKKIMACNIQLVLNLYIIRMVTICGDYCCH